MNQLQNKHARIKNLDILDMINDDTYKKGDDMVEGKQGKTDLVHKLSRKLALVEIEMELIKISCSLVDDEVYTVDDAVDGLIKVIHLIEMEREGAMRDIERYSVVF